MIIKTGREAELTIFLEALEKREIERYKALGKPYDKYKLTPEGIQEVKHLRYSWARADARAAAKEEMHPCQQISFAEKIIGTISLIISIIALVISIKRWISF